MGSTVFDVILLGLGIAFNPIAMVVSILILSQPAGKRKGTAFVIGWVLGLAVLVIVPSFLLKERQFLLQLLPAKLPAILWVGLGILFLLAALITLRRQPETGTPPQATRLLSLVAGSGLGKTLGLGTVLAVFSLRNLVLIAAAASVIGSASLTMQSMAIAIAAFVATSSLGVGFPVLIQASGSARAAAALQAGGDWLTRNMGTLTALVMVLIGLGMLVHGLQELR